MASDSQPASPARNAATGRSLPQLKRIQVRSRWHGAMRTSHSVRQFAFDTAEPERAGGDDSAPTPMEYVAAGLAGCMAVVLETVAGERGIDVRALAIDVEATMDVRGFLGTADVSPHFRDVTVRARIDVPDPGVLGVLRDDVEQRCPAMTLIRDAGVPVLLDWSTGEVAA